MGILASWLILGMYFTLRNRTVFLIHCKYLIVILPGQFPFLFHVKTIC